MFRRKVQVCLAVVGAVLGLAACSGSADITDGSQESALTGTSAEELGPNPAREIAVGCMAVCQKACPPDGPEASALPIEDVRLCTEGCVASGGNVCLAEYRNLLRCFAMQPSSDLVCLAEQFPVLETNACDDQSIAYLDCLFGSF